MRRFTSGPLHGTALALYFVLLPYVVVDKWELSARQGDALFLRLMLVVLSCFWLAFLLRVLNDVVRLRHGRMIGRDGSAWLAGLVVMALPFLLASSSGSTTRPDTGLAVPYALPLTPPSWSLHTAATPHEASKHQRPLGSPYGAAPPTALSLALVAKQRKDSLRRHQFSLSESEIDDTVAVLKSYDSNLIARLRSLVGERRAGTVVLTRDGDYDVASRDDGARAVCILSEDHQGSVISFASEGCQLQVPAHWRAEDVVTGVVALHDGGRLVFARDHTELLRALATRALRTTLVVYLASPHDLDDELRGCAVTLTTADPGAGGDDGGTWEVTADVHPLPAEAGELRAELLRSDPRIVGLEVPFTTTLRRRCVEMTTYLALHRHEPVTGDRLRTRVLASGEVDASTRTLANTASAVRRSLGRDGAGARLHPVSPSGLYVTHALVSDVEIFHGLVSRARQLSMTEAGPLLAEALELVHGEPLASVLRGFEWFLAEGHAARLARDGEWAALALHHDALTRGDYEVAFWALERGRLIDPYSDVLADALARVPRLREFGGDGSGRAQHEAVSAGGAEQVGWSFQSLRNQIA
ncbi:MAG: bacterial transcriptional activator domain-containing protein [Acidimicrobiales bacterium]